MSQISSPYMVVYGEYNTKWHFILKTIFRALLGLQQNWTKNTEISHILPCLHIYFPASTIINIPQHNGTFVLIDELTPTQYIHPKFIVYRRVHFCYYTLYGFGQNT